MSQNDFTLAVVSDHSAADTDHADPLEAVKRALTALGTAVTEITPFQSARLLNDKSGLLIVVDRITGHAATGAENSSDALRELLGQIRSQSADVPVFLYGESLTARSLPTEVLAEIEGVINAYEDTPEFVAKVIHREATRYVERLAPPFFKALMDYSNDGAYSWHCPGHSGGTAFLKSPAGTVFHQFFGENMLRSDVCNAVEELGQLLDHTGPVAESEARAAETFGADHLFFVTNGTSTSNKVVWNSAVSAGDVVLVDRNCHKSILHAIILTGAIPIYLWPTRNRAGIIGPIPRSEFSPESIAEKIRSHPAITDKSVTPRILTLTQSTYDGVVYNAEEIKSTLDGYVDVLHFDEAWLPHARFHELYRGMHGVDERTAKTQKSLVYATQSTHKLLAGLSQASQILVQNSEETELDRDIFNEAYLMHTSTSPQYSIIASCDVSAEMMRGPGGHALVEETITEAMEFRRAIIRIGDERADSDWWFGVWGPDTPPREGLAERAEWQLSASDNWHGFGEIGEDFAMLDPIKVTLTTPGLSIDGEFGDFGIPGLVLSKYLAEHGVVVEKTGLYSLFILFTIGVTKGRWNTLIAELHRFKSAVDSNVRIDEIMPEFVAESPQYAGLGLKDLCQRLHELYREHDFANLTTDIYLEEPAVALLPTDAWAAMTSGKIEHVGISQLEGRISAVLLTPYPPGIPLLVPGERVSPKIVEYLKAEAELARRYPGFNGITHGLTAASGGENTVACVIEEG
ncbi:arginine/lysine/ornithine decarboxylase [Brevibacterium casei]|uniref:Lysine decarboxylase n=2 Tax=Brevibacterium TaxID=1696 RepID=A0A161S3A7_9MICO|nr:arginine/lysine/ornithine decarboxylase [Brevibacterium casei]NJE67283.1 lysine decarboxylase [Brevibacterium sp. LS14]KZE23471.1 lysine decarboxylase [Brevibacterium casei]MBE4693463.1 arginine/lysine/ornithine decarboxylase [Brevibacterium casei]MBY3576586.1 arginine/lysine/ornithine decarboxylase [Brevibacterium casei]MCT2181501.1 arginine/lysine/ornithine decarboxylase [Brevibacterium casei]